MQECPLGIHIHALDGLEPRRISPRDERARLAELPVVGRLVLPVHEGVLRQARLLIPGLFPFLGTAGEPAVSEAGLPADRGIGVIVRQAAVDLRLVLGPGPELGVGAGEIRIPGPRAAEVGPDMREQRVARVLAFGHVLERTDGREPEQVLALSHIEPVARPIYGDAVQARPELLLHRCGVRGPGHGALVDAGAVRPQVGLDPPNRSRSRVDHREPAVAGTVGDDPVSLRR